MSARFRIVHFMPDPFSGGRVPIAALVEGADYRLQVARATFIPGPQCVGGKAAWSVLHMTLEDLERTSNFNELPASVGPHVVLDEARRVPETVADPVRWVESFILPRRAEAPEDQAERPPPAPRRQAHGQAFLKTWKVDRYVRRNFDGSSLGVQAGVAHSISHWVPGSQELLLMEPVVGMRADVHADLRDISQIFLAWRTILLNRSAVERPRLIAYVLGGSYRNATARAREVLAEARAEVVDVDVPAERERLLEDIRRAGSSGGGQGGLG